MASSLALKRLVSSSNILPSSMRVVRPMAMGPSTSSLFSTNANGDRDERHLRDDRRGVFGPLSPTSRSLAQVLLSSMVMKGEAKESKNILRPLSPHLSVYKPLLNATLSVSIRISAVFLTASFYEFLFYSEKLLPVTGSIAAVALIYHTVYGVRNIIADYLGR